MHFHKVSVEAVVERRLWQPQRKYNEHMCEGENAATNSIINLFLRRTASASTSECIT